MSRNFGRERSDLALIVMISPVKRVVSLVVIRLSPLTTRGGSREFQS
jgi:hypothetical protein